MAHTHLDCMGHLRKRWLNLCVDNSQKPRHIHRVKKYSLIWKLICRLSIII